ncbi:transmembrane protein 256 homolog [Xenia sp. Carnegie-2017]|uniref:transmembrane protein 256 homolog n=1 Tax=Xenia sp. Carnegie-2017 TaxID=2897299 RepID=UPI001F03341C|nr:transmembrane protein 256 homolog [Xenia sp. Carnegie-2017]
MAVTGVFSKLFQEPNVFYTLAGISGALAVALGAYGSHSKILNLPGNEIYKKAFESANKYHFIHTLVLLSIPFLNRPYLTGSLFLGGILLFCGSCYVVAFTQDVSYSKPAPFGGVLFIAAWLSMAI